VGEEITYENCVFKVLAVTDRRIEQLQITINEPEAAEEDETQETE